MSNAENGDREVGPDEMGSPGETGRQGETGSQGDTGRPLEAGAVADDSSGAGQERKYFRWELIVLVMAGLMLVLGIRLWRRLERVDPLQRCAGAYQGVHTAVDSGLVDRIEVRWPDRDTRTTCGALRAAGELERLPHRRPSGGGLLPPPPQ